MPNFPAAKLMDSIVGIDVHSAQMAMRLQQLGLTSAGANQVLRAQPISSAADRELVAKIVAAALSGLTPPARTAR